MGAIWPKRFTGRMARVAGPTRPRAAATSSRCVVGSESTNTGCAPARDTASADAMKVFAGTTTSSPGPMSRARRASSIASVPLPTPTQWPTPQARANSSSKAPTSGPRTKAPLEATRSIPARTSSAISPYCQPRSTSGMRFMPRRFALPVHPGAASG